MRQHPPHRIGGMVLGQGKAEFVVAAAGRDRAVSVAVWPGWGVRVDADQHRLTFSCAAGQIGDFDAGVQHDPPDPDPDRVLQLVGRFRVAVHDDSGRVHAGSHGDGQFAGRAHVDAQAFFVRPACHRRGQQRLSGIHDLNPPQHLAVAAGPLTKICFVDHIGGGVEFVGDIRQGYVADAEPAFLVGMCSGRPDRGIQSPGRRPADGRQHVEQCHEFKVRRVEPP